jgi:hypothetical protein
MNSHHIFQKHYGGNEKWLALLILLTWQILLILQGLDLADTGFHLTAFRFIHEDPYSVQYSMMYWLSDIIGAAWMQLFPSGGLLWMRIGWVFPVTLASLFYFLILRKIMSERAAVTGLLISVVFLLRGGPESINYDVLTAVFLSVGLFVLVEGVSRKYTWLYLLSGCILGASVFLKLSNIVVVAFFLMLPVAKYVFVWRWNETFRAMIAWLIGFAAGVSLVIAWIWIEGDWDLFTENLRFLVRMGADEGSTHGLIPMVVSYARGYAVAAIILALFLVLAFFAGWWIDRKSLQHKSGIMYTAIIFLALAAMIAGMALGEPWWSKIRYLFIGLMIFHATLVLADRTVLPAKRVVALAGLILLLIAPLGSNTALAKVPWGIWILGPLMLDGLFREGIAVPFRRFGDRTAFHYRTALRVVITITALIYAYQYTYNDIGSRLEKRYTVDHPLLKGIHTSKKRASAMNEILHAADPLIRDYEFLLSFNEIPLFNYLADKKPFISTSWPKLYYDPEMFRVKLNEAVEYREVLPAVIRQLQPTRRVDWPQESPAPYNYWEGHAIVLDRFLEMNDYVPVWENDMFRIYLPIVKEQLHGQ